jgi:hypothetical protein
MARYRILYWGHIPIGIKATDISGTVRQNLPERFQEAFGVAALHSQSQGKGSFTTSNFRWGEEQRREGPAAAVASAIARELDETWDETEALALYEKHQEQPKPLDLRKL